MPKPEAPEVAKPRPDIKNLKQLKHAARTRPDRRTESCGLTVWSARSTSVYGIGQDERLCSATPSPLTRRLGPGPWWTVAKRLLALFWEAKCRGAKTPDQRFGYFGTQSAEPYYLAGSGGAAACSLLGLDLWAGWGIVNKSCAIVRRVVWGICGSSSRCCASVPMAGLFLLLHKFGARPSKAVFLGARSSLLVETAAAHRVNDIRGFCWVV